MTWSNAKSLACQATMALLLSAGTGLAASDPALIEAAEKEGTVTWASGLIVSQAVRPIAAAFEEKYGIKVEITNVDNLLLRMTNEAQAGKPTIDIFDNAGNTIAAMREADLIVPYASPEATRYRPEHKDPENYWVSCCLFYYGVAINTEMVKPEDEPKTYKDLLDPRWKDQMAWQDNGNYGEPPSFVGAQLMSMGEEAGMAYLEKLAKQNITRIPGNARKVLDGVILGQHALSVMALNHHVAISSQQGVPVKWLKMSPLIGTSEVIGLAKRRGSPQRGKIAVRLPAVEGRPGGAEGGLYLPADPKIQAKVPELKPEGGNFTAVVIQPSMNEDSLPKWRDIYQRLFVGQ